jgi:hypothetical protein
MMVNTKPWVRRKNRKLFWFYPWVAFNGDHTCHFSDWEDAIAFATSPLSSYALRNKI